MAVFGLPGGMEWVFILVVVLVIFGPTQLPKLAKMFGKSAKVLKEGLDGTLADDDEKPADAAAKPADAKPADAKPAASDWDVKKDDES